MRIATVMRLLVVAGGAFRSGNQASVKRPEAYL
jgi:hypothetical protein